MTSTKHGEKRKDGEASDFQGANKRHRSEADPDAWTFLHALYGAVNNHNFERARELMDMDRTLRTQASMNCVEQSAEIIKDFAEQIVVLNSVIEQLSERLQESRAMEMKEENSKLKAEEQSLREALRKLFEVCEEGKFRISELAAEVDGAKGTITILQLCIGKLVNEKAALAAQIEKLLQESDVRKHLAQEDEAQKHRMQEFIVRQEQELRAAKGFSKAYQQDAERYKKKLGRLNQERKADMSICKQEADMLRHELHETKQQVLAGPSLQQAVAELRAQVASQHAALQAGKAREAKLAAELSHANASTSAEHRARSEVERELGKMSRDQYDARKASLLPPAGLPVYDKYKDGDWLVITPDLEKRVRSGEIIWVAKGLYTEIVEENGFKQQGLRVQYYEWNEKTERYEPDVEAFVKRDFVLFYTTRLPANKAQKVEILEYVNMRWGSMSSTSAELPRRA